MGTLRLSMGGESSDTPFLTVNLEKSLLTVELVAETMWVAASAANHKSPMPPAAPVGEKRVSSSGGESGAVRGSSVDFDVHITALPFFGVEYGRDPLSRTVLLEKASLAKVAWTC
mmetsp:Transcript_11885/g.17151  ORF Transcript_11885/g.17151 Transcript_11885/m.17151 type:complete len:115 (+) Transcript_11885:930-1274(+)